MSEEQEKQLAPINRRDNALLVTDAPSQLVARARRDIAVFLKDATDPLSKLRQQAERGDPEAQIKLGDEYNSRCGWCLTCWHGNPCQEHGPDHLSHEYRREAAAWYLKAAELGNVSGQLKIANAYVDGKGVPQNALEAARWFRSAAERGDREGQYQLACAYRQGSGVPQDASEAVNWYLKAADQRHLYAIDDLGVMYETGEGVPHSSAEALRYFAMATTDDWWNGDDGGWDPDVFTNMWRSAAEFGCARAQYLYAATREYSGREDRIEGYMWYDLAAASGELDAVLCREKIAVRMSSEQIKEAQRRAREWKPKM